MGGQFGVAVVLRQRRNRFKLGLSSRILRSRIWARDQGVHNTATLELDLFEGEGILLVAITRSYMEHTPCVSSTVFVKDQTLNLHVHICAIRLYLASDLFRIPSALLTLVRSIDIVVGRYARLAVMCDLRRGRFSN